MSQARFLILLVALSMNFQRASAVVLENTLEKWQRYSDACFRNMSRDSQSKGVVCNRTFDKYACWPDGLPNTTVNVSCPWYLPWYSAVQGGFVFRKCGPDGQWVMDSVKQPWRDSSQCKIDPKDDRAQQEQGRILDGFIVMYTVGFSLSLGTLVLALGILVGFRKLHCTRNYIHMNLFASFILRAMSILIKDALFKTQYNQIPEDVDIKVWFNNETAAGCRSAQVLMQYCIGANYYWLLIEGIYLHNLLVVTIFSERNYFNIYLCIGWGSPVLFVVPWVVIKYLYENTGCWTTNENMAYWWIIRTPILLSILINFFIFIRIIHILVSKLRAHQMRYTDYKFRLAKSTLTLIPLLGIHEVVFAFVTDEHAQGTLRHVKLFFELFLNSFQGMLVAILYCFVNREVQTELLKKWKRWKLGKDVEEEYRHTYSHPGQYRNGSASLEKHKLDFGHLLSHVTPGARFRLSPILPFRRLSLKLAGEQVCRRRDCAQRCWGNSAGKCPVLTRGWCNSFWQRPPAIPAGIRCGLSTRAANFPQDLCAARPPAACVVGVRVCAGGGGAPFSLTALHRGMPVHPNAGAVGELKSRVGSWPGRCMSCLSRVPLM